MADKIYKIQKELEEKRAKRKQARINQQTLPLPDILMHVSLPNPIFNPRPFPMDKHSPQQPTSRPATSIPGPRGSTEPSVDQSVSMPGVINNPNMSTDPQNIMLMQQLTFEPVSDPKKILISIGQGSIIISISL